MPVTAPQPAAPVAAPKTESNDASSSLYDVHAEIEALDNEASPPAEDPKAQPTVTEPKTKSVSEEVGADLDAIDKDHDEDGNKVETPTDGEQKQDQDKPEETEAIPTRARDLKRVYEETKAAKKQLETKLTEAEKRIETLQRTNPDEVKALTEKLSKAEARRDELEQKIRFTDYRESAEFKEKFEAPINDAWQRAILDLNETVVTNEDGSTRRAAVEDLVRLSNLPLQQAAKMARDMFGDAAEDILAHRRTIRELSIQQEKALERVKKEAVERRKTEEVENRARAEKYQSVWKQESDALGDKFPKWVKPVEGDEEGNKLLEAGYQEVDRFFNDNTLQPEERIKRHATIRMKAANHDRMALRLRRMAEKVKTMKEKLAGYEQSAPPAGKTGPRTVKKGGSVYDDINAEIDALNMPDLHD